MSASLKLNDTEIFSELNQTVTAKNINVAANDTTTPSMCKAWVNFNGNIDASSDTPANHLTTANNGIRAAHNVDYIIDRGAGDYEVHFENAMADENYCVTALTNGNGNSSRGFNVISLDKKNNGTGTSPSQTSIRINSYISSSSVNNAALEDSPDIMVQIFR